MSVTETINNYLDHELAGDLATVLCTGHAGRLLDALPAPWPEDTPSPTATPYSDDLGQFLLKGGPLVVGGSKAIPTAEHDTLLDSVRGRWRRPLTLQRKDFETTFASRERRVVPVEEVLADLRAGKFQTAASLARYYDKAHSWTGSLKWFLLRNELLNNTGEWDKFFPAAKKPKQKGK